MALTVTGASSYASSMTKTADIRPAHGAVRGPAALLTVMVLVTLLALLPDGARAAPPQGAGELEKQDVEAWLDGMLPALLEREAIPGASVSVVHDGEVLTERGYGFADLGTDSTGGTGWCADPPAPEGQPGARSSPNAATASPISGRTAAGPSVYLRGPGA